VTKSKQRNCAVHSSAINKDIPKFGGNSFGNRTLSTRRMAVNGNNYFFVGHFSKFVAKIKGF
jgi:hypothetical protein